MSGGYVLDGAPPTETNGLDQTHRLAELLAAIESERRQSNISPLRPSLRLPASSSSLGEDAQSCEATSAPSSSLGLSVPSMDYHYASSSTSVRTHNHESDTETSGLEDGDGECEESMSHLIPHPDSGVHFHACSRQLIMVAASAPVHRVVSVHYKGTKVYKVNTQKPTGVNQQSFSANDALVSTRSEEFVAIVRRGAKSKKVTLTVYKHNSGDIDHHLTYHPIHLISDFTAHGHPSTPVLIALEERVYLLGNQNMTHVWSLDVSRHSLRNRELMWRQEHTRGFPRPNTTPTHIAGCPRVGLSWKSHIVVIGVESSPMKQRSLNHHNSSRKKPSKKANISSSRPSPPDENLQSLNVWQFSVLNRTWSKRPAVTNAPQGVGKSWPPSLHGCMVGESIACIAVGRKEGTCIWTLDLSTCTWWEIPGLLPRGSCVHGMSSVGSIVYFMGQGLDPDTSSPVVHCNMANFEPWIESSQPPKGIESMFFPPSISLPGSEPPSPNHETKEHPLMSLASSTEISVSSSLLPSYDSLPPPMNPHTASFLFFTPYRRMHTATDDSQFEKIKIDLSTEWMTCAMIVMCLIGVDSAILGLSKEGTIMPMDTSGERAIAVSMMSSAIGLAVSAWMYCIYYPQEGDLFRLRALDALNTYAIFSIRARIPILCVGVATSAFLIFVVHTLSAMFPEVVAPLLALLGILIGLNWFIYFYHLVRFAFSYVSKAVLYVFRRGSTPPPAETTDGNSKQSSEATAAS